jgi:nucleotide-binding universal stress UspA family protein
MKQTREGGKPLSNVVVPVDGSRYSTRAIEPAKALALCIGADIGVVRLVRDRSDEDLHDLENLVEDHALDWCQLVVDSDVAHGICAVADEHDALICMATHGQGRATAVLGSTAEAVLAWTQTPVVLVGRGVDRGQHRTVGRLVVPLDGHADSELACEPALRWARQLQLTVNFITVAPPAIEPLRSDQEPLRVFGPPGDPDAYIAGIVDRYRTEDVTVAGEVLYDPVSPASGLALLLRDVKDAVVIMATHDRHGLQRFIHGSVAGSIVDKSPAMAVLLPVQQLI